MVKELYSTVNDPQPQMIPRPQVIPKIDRNWSLKSTANDAVKNQGMEWILRTDYKK